MYLSLYLSLSSSLSFCGQVMSTHHSDQMSQRSHVSRAALCMSKSKVAQSLSESVTRSPIELSAGQLKTEHRRFRN